jgi:hypothetical protein
MVQEPGTVGLDTFLSFYSLINYKLIITSLNLLHS